MASTDNFSAIIQGFCDSLKGFKVAYYLDGEINERVARAPTPSPIRTAAIAGRRPSREGTPPDRRPTQRSNVTQRILQCSMLNGAIFLASLMIFEFGLLPSIRLLLQFIFGDKLMDSWWWIEALLSLLFQTTWVVPLFIISRLVNMFWFQDIANLAYRYSRGRPISLPSWSKTIADLVFSVLIQTLFLIQAVLINYIPIYLLGYLLSSVHMCLLYSLYSFDYKWSNMGWELHKRLAYIETNWPYFIGFGLPLTISTQLMPNCALSGCVFAILFPFFIISGHVATPVTGVSSYPLHIFSPVIAVSNALFILIRGRKTRSVISSS